MGDGLIGGSTSGGNTTLEVDGDGISLTGGVSVDTGSSSLYRRCTKNEFRWW